MSIVEFLLARIAEDESAAERGGWHNSRGTFANDNYGCLLIQPARVLAECAAKREIVGTYKLYCAYAGQEKLGEDRRAEMRMHAMTVYENLRHLAAVYADHPDHDPEWA